MVKEYTVSPQTLEELGLTPEDQQSVNTQIAQEAADKEERHKQILEHEGRKIYENPISPAVMDLREGFFVCLDNSHIPVKYRSTRNKANIPDEIIQSIRFFEQDVQIRRDVITFIKGFGNAALEAQDWSAAISAFDVITEGGIRASEVMGKFKQIAAENKQAGVEIGTALDARAAQKGAGQI